MGQSTLIFHHKKYKNFQNTWVAESVKRLPSAQVMISGPWVRLPAQWVACFSLSLRHSPRLCTHTHPLSQINSFFFLIFERESAHKRGEGAEGVGQEDPPRGARCGA